MTDLCAAVAADGCGTFDYQRVSQRSAAVDTEVAAVRITATFRTRLLIWIALRAVMNTRLKFEPSPA